MVVRSRAYAGYRGRVAARCGPGWRVSEPRSGPGRQVTERNFGFGPRSYQQVASPTRKPRNKPSTLRNFLLRGYFKSGLTDAWFS